MKPCVVCIKGELQAAVLEGIKTAPCVGRHSARGLYDIKCCRFAGGSEGR